MWRSAQTPRDSRRRQTAPRRIPALALSLGAAAAISACGKASPTSAEVRRACEYWPLTISLGITPHDTTAIHYLREFKDRCPRRVQVAIQQIVREQYRLETSGRRAHLGETEVVSEAYRRASR